MSARTIYTLANCSTCRDATKWLRARAVAFEEKAIRETPPTLAELRERYPDTWPTILPKNCANDCVTAFFRDGLNGPQHECASEVEALEWLAAQLEAK